MQSPQFAGRAGRGRLAARIAATAKRSPAKARMTSTKMKKRTPKVPISAEASRPYSRYQEVDMRKVRHALLVALALAGLGLAACGGAGGGCLVFWVGDRHPGVLAKALTTIDHLSGGRAECGIGAGWDEIEFASYGISFPPIKVREDQLEEYAEVLRLLFDQKRASFSGRHFRLVDAPNNPKPVQQRLPLWIGGAGEK